MATAAAVSRHLVHLASADPEGEGMTPLRLHKLLYYCQGWHLAWYGRPLFAERIEAWRYGPVVPDVYAQPWGQGREVIPDVPATDDLSAAERGSVEQVWREYGRYSAHGLRDMTHLERPWATHFTPDAGNRCVTEIPSAELLTYFGERFTAETGEQVGCMAESEAAVAEGRTISHEQMLKELGW
jgi:uncharacterized phage-associated protein